MSHDQVIDQAIAVLGCKLGRDALDGRSGTFVRRTSAAARAYAALSRAPDTRVWVVASGGRAWGDVVEADAMADELVRLGVPRERVVRERCSHSTRENAAFTAEILGRRGLRRVTVVTCHWHMARALRHFENAGLAASPFPAWSPELPGALDAVRRAVRSAREWVLARAVIFAVLLFTALLTALLAACSKAPPPAPSAGDAAAPLSTEQVLRSIARAEDLRRTADVDVSARTSHDVVIRRRATRALARIADDAALPSLLRALSDEDPETAAFAAYGLGFECKGHEAAHVPALAARAASFSEPAKPTARIDLPNAIARALGHCATSAQPGAAAEATLLAWLRTKPSWAEAAALSLGDVAGRRGDLGDDTITGLLDAATGGGGRSPLPVALYPLGRLKSIREPFAARAVESARALLGTTSPDRIFAVRALGHAGPLGAPELLRVVTSRGAFTAAERGEAARALASSEAGKNAAADALTVLGADKAALDARALLGDELDVWLALLGSLPAEPPPKAEHVLYTLSAATISASEAPPGVAQEASDRRAARLRCTAALALVKGGYDTDVLTRCAPAGSEELEAARLAALLRRPLLAERRHAWTLLSKSAHLRVREAAIDGLATHPEVGDAGRAAIALALSAKEPGLVATAADLLKAHPDRALAITEQERRAALDPSAPPPTANPEKQIDPQLAEPFARALATDWSEDLVETRVSLLEAAAALGLPQTKAAAKKACGDANATLRMHAKKILAALGDTSTCAVPATPGAAAPEIDAPLTLPTHLAITTDAGAKLAITFDVDLAPVTAARLSSLARAGFYKGIVVHRVVPGFVVQLGDPGADGYGGSGHALRCETSPAPFRALDVGMALAGRDTGSSQFFVALARAPHLDGEYAIVGHAEGDFDAVAEGDVIRDVVVTP